MPPCVSQREPVPRSSRPPFHLVAPSLDVTVRLGAPSTGAPTMRRHRVCGRRWRDRLRPRPYDSTDVLVKLLESCADGGCAGRADSGDEAVVLDHCPTPMGSGWSTSGQPGRRLVFEHDREAICPRTAHPSGINPAPVLRWRDGPAPLLLLLLLLSASRRPQDTDRGHRANPGRQAARLPGGEPGRARRGADAGRSGPHRRGRAAGRRQRRAIPGAGVAGRQSLDGGDG